MFEVHTPWTELIEIWINLDWLTGLTKKMKVAKLESMFLSHLSWSFHFSVFGQSDQKLKKSAVLFMHFLYKIRIFPENVFGNFDQET